MLSWPGVLLAKSITHDYMHASSGGDDRKHLISFMRKFEVVVPNAWTRLYNEVLTLAKKNHYSVPLFSNEATFMKINTYSKGLVFKFSAAALELIGIPNHLADNFKILKLNVSYSWLLPQQNITNEALDSILDDMYIVKKTGIHL